MRRIVGYVEGRAVWSENIPAASLTFHLRGALVVGAPGPTENERARKRVAANQATSVRYRARHPDRVNEYQRDYRARLRAAVRSERSA